MSIAGTLEIQNLFLVYEKNVKPILPHPPPICLHSDAILLRHTLPSSEILNKWLF
jgi:hypothetical protein